MGANLSNYFGIDFGTTSSATVGYMVMDHTPEEFLYGDEEGRPIPSVVESTKRQVKFLLAVKRGIKKWS